MGSLASVNNIEYVILKHSCMRIVGLYAGQHWNTLVVCQGQRKGLRSS